MNNEEKHFGGLVKSNLHTAWYNTKSCHFSLDLDLFPRQENEIVFKRDKTTGIQFAGVVIRGSKRQSDIVIIEKALGVENIALGTLYCLKVEDHAFFDSDDKSVKKVTDFNNWRISKLSEFAAQINANLERLHELEEKEKLDIAKEELEALELKRHKRRLYAEKRKRQRIENDAQQSSN